jgi:hypothetical protein
MRPWPLKLCLLVFIASAMLTTESRADGEVRLGEELPGMFILICPTLEAAHKQAASSAEQANSPVSLKRPPERFWLLFPIVVGCAVSYQTGVIPREREQGIEPFSAWTEAPDENGPFSSFVGSAGKRVAIRTSPLKQEARFYFVDYPKGDGTRSSGWAEIPNRPYGVVYGELQKGK